ncbi:MAG: acyl carrier protein [Clostridia bacterium]|nr:acyl carrier protein [Clostridia bacterium]MDE6075124.1 acyl carrier protein [Clostridia bacterium]MDE7401191.1 acyl carrier protein [Clostridia bacterium]
MFDKVAQLLAEQLGIPQSKITPESKIIEDLGADSLDVVELLMQLEDETGKTIPDDEVTKIKTVGEIVEVIEKL